MRYFRRNLFLCILLPLLAVVTAVSFYRFILAEDYLVEYEGACDPASQSCYFACEDDDCMQVYPYAIVQKRAADVHAQCGSSIAGCDAASRCLDTDQSCSITYCDTESEECAALDPSGEGAALEEEDGKPNIGL